MHRSFALVLCSALLAGCTGRAVATPGLPQPTITAEPVYLVIRTDDAGMSHSVNMALERLIRSGLPVSVSVMFATPWYQETVDILKRHPDVAVGVHLTLNSEWKNLRWGPVAGRGTVPTLVDPDGFFFPTSAALYGNNPSLSEVEVELRAQLERARRSGLRIDYLDFHMGTVSRYPEFRAIAERLAEEYGLGISRYFGEESHDPHYAVPPAQKPDTLVALVNRLAGRYNLLVTHVGIDDAELGALVDMNTDGGLGDMSRHRQGELDALTSPRFREALRARGVRLITYRQLIEMQGLKSMQRPGGG